MFELECSQWIKIFSSPDVKDSYIANIGDTLELWKWLSTYLNPIKYEVKDMLDIMSWRSIYHPVVDDNLSKPSWIHYFEQIALDFKNCRRLSTQHIKWLRKQFTKWSTLSLLQQHLLTSQCGWKEIALQKPKGERTHIAKCRLSINNKRYMQRQFQKLTNFRNTFNRDPTLNDSCINARALARWMKKMDKTGLLL